MKLNLTTEERLKFKELITKLWMDLVDGELESPDQVATALEDFARQIRSQMAQQVDEAVKNQVS